MSDLGFDSWVHYFEKTGLRVEKIRIRLVSISHLTRIKEISGFGISAISKKSWIEYDVLDICTIYVNLI